LALERTASILADDWMQIGLARSKSRKLSSLFLTINNKQCIHVYTLRKEDCMAISSSSTANSIRQHATEKYVSPARRQPSETFCINVGGVHKELGLNNRIPAVCSALTSKKFLSENHLRLISIAGPPSGKSTTVTYTYEFIDGANSAVPRTANGSGGAPQSRQAAWEKLRGALKDVFAEYGGGEAYLRAERISFRDADEHK
jgi:hypothetical protein